MQDKQLYWHARIAMQMSKIALWFEGVMLTSYWNQWHCVNRSHLQIMKTVYIKHSITDFEAELNKLYNQLWNLPVGWSELPPAQKHVLLKHDLDLYRNAGSHKQVCQMKLNQDWIFRVPEIKLWHTMTYQVESWWNKLEISVLSHLQRSDRHEVFRQDEKRSRRGPLFVRKHGFLDQQLDPKVVVYTAIQQEECRQSFRYCTREVDINYCRQSCKLKRCKRQFNDNTQSGSSKKGLNDGPRNVLEDFGGEES